MTATPGVTTPPTDEQRESELLRDLTRGWLRHQGWTEGWIALGESQTHKLCEFDSNSQRWNCTDEDDQSLHPERDAVDEAAETARWFAEAFADQAAMIYACYEQVAEDINAMPAGDHLSDVAVVGWQLAAMYAAAMVREASK